MYGCESWTVKKAERRRIDAFELGPKVKWQLRSKEVGICFGAGPRNVGGGGTTLSLHFIILNNLPLPLGRKYPPPPGGRGEGSCVPERPEGTSVSPLD